MTTGSSQQMDCSAIQYQKSVSEWLGTQAAGNYHYVVAFGCRTKATHCLMTDATHMLLG